MSKRWTVGEPTNVHEYLKRKNNEIKVGDTIEYVSNNQQGWVLYKVVSNNKGEKSLHTISDYDSMMYGSTLVSDEEETDDDASVGSSKSKGGRKRYKKKTLRKKSSRRNKSRKNKSRRGRK
jgi:hypothetical protein